MSAWVKEYVGIPFLEHGRTRIGCDCWGLVRMVLAEQYGVGLPSYATAYQGTDREHACRIGELFDDRWPLPEWREVALDDALPGDLLLLRRMGGACHVGVVAGPGVMLHVVAHSNACVEHYDRRLWRRRIEGVYRHGST